MKNQICCDGIQRRDFLKIGALAGAGFALPDYYSAANSEPKPSPPGRRAKTKRNLPQVTNLSTIGEIQKVAAIAKNTNECPP